ncbi:putative toxin-antitoxin system toxin component, PIN family [Acutalibacter muris]|uniref:Toxin-antitoxin system toxin component, PIN family n=1 Tax=Acutalibacter muris TaxID=1796620 RepID=A0A1Z2XP40_9FIRM|nr:putative toxin-antitoxin system toxin component, PIN family [Acutalibacter muris]ANU53111.1 putative toxin-antitoxin system toxin component, PIN family [Hungateiclostridiaceae bacterium KB18]ASB40212.1 putative toxin-antitoxin system toxin component, PIN family [Acutalibacter muris]QQR29498.1 putative toxin-antitoxin system toxin component, PIN family [Acutalibacter muris]
MKYYAVIDTNVLVSAALKAHSAPGDILNEIGNGRIIPLYNDAILAEYAEVLHRPKFRFEPRAVKVILDSIIRYGVPIDAGPIEDIVPDPKDVVFYEVVMEQRKTEDAYLVTGNLKHFPVKPFVVTPRQMLDLIFSEQSED